MPERELTALVADDEELVREFLVEMLSAIPNLRIDTASNGNEAYTKIKTRKPDILYTDVLMGGMNGDALLESLVAEGIKIPTFVCSGSFQEDVGARALFYATRMYTDEQITKLGIDIQPDTEAQKRFILQKEDEQRVAQLQVAQNRYIPYDFGFPALSKPVGMDSLLDRTKTVINMLYEHS
ncbi:response regulator [Candidatus Woesearchaeota archaeon]|nr:response regulator [Candidatus Woesearchaeota archaeon]